MGVGLVVNAAHRLRANLFVVTAQTYALAVTSKAGREITAAAVVTAKVTTSAIIKEWFKNVRKEVSIRRRRAEGQGVRTSKTTR